MAHDIIVKKIDNKKIGIKRVLLTLSTFRFLFNVLDANFTTPRLLVIV